MASLYEKFTRNGYAVVEDFLSSDEPEKLKIECQRLIEEMDLKDHRSIFRCGDKQEGDEYFITSGDKIRFFFEEKAFNEKGDLVVDKMVALNKIGHALHWLNPEFKRVTFKDNVKEVAKDLGFIEPKVALSMYIFKHPGVSSAVLAHQDGAYIYTTPQSCVGFWIALEDVTTENGCLWFIPGSHKTGTLYRRLVRNADGQEPLIKHTAPDLQFDDDLFIPVPVTKGSLILIDGLVIHKSGLNKTNRTRDIYSFHVIESHQTEYSLENWLQPTEKLPFPSLYTTKNS